jgi:Exopolysaccharide synthesis, ExoD
MSELTQSRPDAGTFIPASVILQKLHDEAPAGHVTLDWLMGSLHKQSFGLIILVLAVVAAAPGICLVGGLLLLIPAFQMIAGRPLPTRHLGAVVQRAIPMLRYLEKAVYPRCPTPLEATKRVVGVAVMMLSARLIFNSDPAKQYSPSPSDRSDRVGLCRGGRVSALDQPPGRMRRHCDRPGNGLGDCPRRKTD